MKNITLLLTFVGILFLGNKLLSQVNEHGGKTEFISSFLEENNATEDEKNRVQCEYSLIFDQYVDKDKFDYSELESIFGKILGDVRQKGELNTSYRLYEPKDMADKGERRHRVEAMNFVYKQGGGKPVEDDGYIKSNSCVNADFESGGLGNWQFEYATSGGPNNMSSGIHGNTMNALTGNHVIMGPGAGNDPRTGNNLPRVYPGGGQYSLRLGDQGTGWNAAKATYTFTVTPQTELFLYHYAVVLEDEGHTAAEQPFLEINLYIDGVEEDCGHYYQAASGGAVGYLTYTPGGWFSTPVRYKPWSTMSIPLTDYMGATATIEFITSDCSQSGHYGYAYIDAECMAMPSLDGEIITCDNPTPTLTAPPGAQTYQWVGPGIVGANNTQSIQVDEPGTYKVTVIPVQGIQCAYEVEVIVTEEIGDVVANFNAVPDEVCLGESINFQNTTTTTGDTGPVSTNAWSFGDGGTASTENPTYTYTTPGNYDVTLDVVTTKGCESTVTKSIVVHHMPVAAITVPGVCEDESSVFTDNSTVNTSLGDAITNWQWSFGDGGTSNQQNPTHQYGSENIYTVSLTVTTNNGCEHTASAQAEVYPMPVVDFSAAPVCLDDATAFVNNSSVSNAHTSNSISTWAWDFGGGSTSSNETPSFVFPNEGFFNTTLTATSNRGCEATETIEITVYPMPEPNFTSTSVCLNDLTDFTDASTVSNAFTSNSIVGWSWDFGNGAISSNQHPTHTYSAEGNYTPELTVTTNNGCIATATMGIDVYPLPVVNFTADAVCQNDFTSFQDNSTVSNAFTSNTIVSWSWNFTDGNVSSEQNPTNSFPAEGIFNPSLTVTTNHGCESTGSFDVTVYPLPTALFTTEPVCLESETEFIDESYVSNIHTSNNITGWSWNFGDGASSNTQNPSYEYGEEGFYSPILTVTTNNGCEASITQDITIFPLPIADFLPTEVCLEAPTVFTDESTVSNAFTQNNVVGWEWDFADGTTADVKNPTHLYTTEGVYPVSLTVTTNNGCVSTGVIDVVVFPNPFANFEIDSVCLDMPSVFTDLSTINSSQGDQIINWDWNFGDGNISSLQNPSHTYGTENVYGVTLSVKSDKGCSHEITKYTAIYPNPFVNFSPTEVCLDTPTEFTDLSFVSTAHTANTLVAWNWDFSDGSTADVKNPVHTYDSDGVYNVVLEVTTNNGCTSTETIPVTVNANPEVSFIGTDLEGCSPICPQITSTSTINSPSTIVNYRWVLSNGQYIESGHPNFVNCFENDFSYDVSYDVTLVATSNKGCVSEHTEYSFINVYHNPVADFSINPTEPDVINNEVDFINSSLYSDSYEWDIDGTSPTTEFSPTVIFPSKPETYQAMLIASTNAGCVDTAIMVFDVLERLIFYVPNTFTPDNDDYNEVFKPIFASGFDPQSYTLYIFNRWGELLFESHDTEVGWKGTYGESSTQIVRDGTYVWKIDFKETMSDKRHTYTGHVNILK